VYSHLAPDGRFWPGGASNVGAGLVGEEFGSADLDQLQRQAAALGPAPAIRYPLPGVGERFPFRHPAAVGFQLGQATTPAAAFRTLLEGVAFAERLGLEALADSGCSSARIGSPVAAAATTCGTGSEPRCSIGR
jgi:xylulokinase